MQALYKDAGKPTANNKDAVLSPIEAADKTNMPAELAEKFIAAGDTELSAGRVAAVL